MSLAHLSPTVDRDRRPCLHQRHAKFFVSSNHPAVVWKFQCYDF